MNRKIPNHLRILVAYRAEQRCEYCRVPEVFLATTFHVDHIRSLKHNGRTILENLSFCCPHCNQNKGSDIATFEDEESDIPVRFYNPRKDLWSDHFELKEGIILPKTNIGEATARILEFNRPERVLLRKALSDAGMF